MDEVIGVAQEAASFDFGIIKMFYHISPEGADEPLFEMDADRFFDAETLGKALDLGGSTVQATSRALPASFVGTTLGKLLLTQVYLYGMYGSVIDLSPERLTFQIEAHDDHAHLGFRIKELLAETVPTEGAARQLAEAWTAHVRAFLRPAVEAAAEAAAMKPAAIWQQYGAMAEYMKEYAATLALPEPVQERLSFAFRVLAEDIPAEAFGTRRNPYQHNPRYCDNPYPTGGDKLMMQSSCCLYDQREGGVKCYTCPMLTPEQRAERREQVLAEQAG
ncbi:(2Fe-2S)-binding protein [Paenibacillus albicereus]|uniref:(2Fe-2S)-binding protein n=1 Tax=Paenibacillus albicereus TaxID=2726185 RepID=A0A6H2H1T1_9BACL|nr:(2Fe-2S)-binding protein [Paenibacillus albicereus]QJC53630.1 (2Fe-2S)-binding protein [Paenibacillus albicereus]